ncbi:rhomboid family intramembrane serine protease [Candidatus Micrarchaeota archaeon]|nr:rhomboid family intramembrane serine protease [Candidatus Micrarchaeota archaeon]
MRFPWATALLTAAVLIVYAYSSGGLLYPNTSLVAQNAFGSANPLALLFSLFFHIGANHVLGNLVPLIGFALLLERSLSGRHVVVVFLASGLVAALVFWVLNPSSFLAGASGGIAGLMTAASLSRPKWGVMLLLGVPLFMSVVAFPVLAWAKEASFSSLDQKASSLQIQADQLEAAGQYEAAAEARAEAEAVNATLTQQEATAAAEARAVPDFFVHAAGALVGMLYVLAFFRERVREGFEELAVVLDSLKARVRGG